MSTLTPPAPAPVAPDLDTSRPGVPLGRLVAVECRKLVDTRASRWLAAAVVLSAAAVTAIVLAFSDPSSHTFANLLGQAALPVSVILPVMAILLVTSEFSQRSALVTFTLEPRRSRVVAAKLGAGVVAAVAAVVVAASVAAAGTALASLLHDPVPGAWDVSAPQLVGAALTQLLSMLTGFAFAMLLLSTPAAIVLYFVLPTVWTLLASLVPWLRDNVQEWADLGVAQLALAGADWPTDGEWLRLATSAAIWLVLPLTLGVARLLRSEVK